MVNEAMLTVDINCIHIGSSAFPITLFERSTCKNLFVYCMRMPLKDVWKVVAKKVRVFDANGTEIKYPPKNGPSSPAILANQQDLVEDVGFAILAPWEFTYVLDSVDWRYKVVSSI
ncbi:hypothetical protein JCGZ_06001 [Jatropha curcas]|uniref:Uncharacterized protein n=1 Tax=Jatropha curcas TaxID=180498 RepID=A0A067KN42_JATCU|nr:hypothetical protein JCGZ_06001 [Jatropha curcas]